MLTKELIFWHPRILKLIQKINLFNVKLNFINKILVYNEKIEGIDKIKYLDSFLENNILNAEDET